MEPARTTTPVVRAHGMEKFGGEVGSWLISLLLVLPATIPYLSHFLSDRGGTLPTGFIQFDMPYYMANAREHFDKGEFQPVYSNPFSPSFDAPVIYFQPLILFLGFVWRTTGLDPGTVFVLTGCLTALVCGRVALALYREVVGLSSAAQWLGLIVFFWGGGLLALAGALASYAVGRPDFLGFRGLFALDPSEGWWVLNFGRNLVYPTEALYHAIFFGCAYSLIRGRWVIGTVMALLGSISHPYTGIELLAIVCAWAYLEVFFVRNRDVPQPLFFGFLGLFVAHLGYYLVFLNRFSEHRALMPQLELDWRIDAITFVPLYALVGPLAFWTIRRYPLAAKFFGESRNRLLAVWGLVAFVMANHEFAVRPVQPIHFERGYVWSALFLMGAGSLVWLFGFLLARRNRFLGGLGIALILAVFLSDNVLWLGSFPIRAYFGKDLGDIRLRRSEAELLAWLNQHGSKDDLLLCRDTRLAYMAMVYTPVRAWASYHHHTPNYLARKAEVDALFDRGRFLDAWHDHPLLIVLPKISDHDGPPAWINRRHATQFFENRTFRLYRIHPGHDRP